MGVLHGRDLLSSKYVTAIIKDKAKRLWFIPIKHTMGEYFLADIDGLIYCFKIDDEICQYRQKLTKQFQVIIYDISHYRPMKSEITELAMLLEKDDLGKVNGMMSEVFRVLASREKKPKLDKAGKLLPFVPHDLMKLIKEMNDYKNSKIAKVIPKNQNKFMAQGKSIINFLDNLDVKQITAPLRSISNYIEDDLKESDPKFFGAVAQSLQILDHENKKVTNTPIKSSTAFVKWLLLIAVIAGVLMFVYWAYDQGIFDELLSIGDSFGLDGISFQPIAVPPPGATGDPCSDTALQKRYPEPLQLKIAVENGSEQCVPSKFMQDIIDGVELPKVKEK